ncbi:MAG: DJ-1 family protein [Nitrospinae bacterium CG11_big_fil_rev_8_21_14_0_20_56_8]|nr:MAG: DJ-1 family protein [Nitrospinae bacterium CG11_big_fil_rev_8_21_14_0_20_56_8]
MKRVLVALAPGFEEIETITVVDILRRSGARVFLAGTQEGPLEGSRGVHVVPDGSIDSVNPQDFDMVVLPGGQPGTNNLRQNSRVRAILNALHSEGKPVAAICAAPLVLHDAGILDRKKSTSHPSVRNQLNGCQYLEDRVVVDGNVITSQSPGTAMEFAMKLVEILFGPDRVKTVNEGVLARI